MKLPKKISLYVKDLKLNKTTYGRSGDITYLVSNKYVLKISLNHNNLFREYEKTKWISMYMNGIKPICFYKGKKYSYFLREALNGESLISKNILNNPNKLISYIKEAFDILKGFDDIKCPFISSENSGNDFVHGDLCLPNIIVANDHVIGFIDLENIGLGDRLYDLSWLIWSFEYNLKTSDYTDKLLDTIGYKINEEKFNQYIPRELRKNVNRL